MKAAAAFYQRACDGGNAGGCSQLAIQYNGGEGVAQDDAKAALFADRSCKGGSPLGCTLLGSVYGDGAPGYPKDVKRAEELFRNACFDKADFKAAPDTVSRAACSSLAKLTGKPACTRNTYPGGPSELICFEDPGTWKVTVTPAAAPPPDPAVTSNAAVNAGNAAYARKDFPTAAAQYASACDAGNASACGVLGDMFVKGEGVRKWCACRRAIGQGL
jgi:uncharacterized protein